MRNGLAVIGLLAAVLDFAQKKESLHCIFKGCIIRQIAYRFEHFFFHGHK
jgi:hypothetical protein